MLTPKEIHEIAFKTGRGYRKEDVDSFMQALSHDYELIYRENFDLRDKVNTLSDGVQYYKNLEKTLQKSLILAERASDETKEAARKQAEIIERQAKLNADMILADAKKDLFQVEKSISDLKQKFELYKSQFRQTVRTQLDFLDSDSFSLEVKEHKVELYSEQENMVNPDSKVFKDPDFTEDLKINAHSFSDKTEKETEKKLSEDVIKEEEKLMEPLPLPEEEEKVSETVINTNEQLKDGKMEFSPDDSSKEEIGFQVKAKENEKAKDMEDDVEEDIEMKMLQKLLNNMKEKIESETADEEFEFISTDLDD